MRTTLELDDDLLAVAKDLARQQGATIGHVISQLARQALKAQAPPKIRNGVPVFVPKAGGPKADLCLVNQLRDDE